MKVLVLLIVLLAVVEPCAAQQIVSKRFFSGKYGDKEVDSSKASHMETITRNADGSQTTEYAALRSGIVLRSTTRRGDEPMGRWIFRNKKGEVEETFDYDFELPRSVDTCSALPRYVMSRDTLEGSVSGRFERPGLADGKDFRGFLADMLRYPDEAVEAGIEGRVVLNAVLTSDGTFENMVVAQSVHPSIDKEAARVVRAARFTKPAMIDGKPAALCVSIPVKFTLE